MNVNLKEENVKIVQVELLVQILAFNKANGYMMIELMKESDRDALLLMTKYHEDVNSNIESILEDLYLRHGKIDFE